ncbi:MAG TPA: TetR/AcrR family transcriptional regulator [Acidimicrobiales bacterium]|jgi:AcrR family transcriptional regulator|nr:TetR/AcrR family transcriptional regulator [Acidimicrobiales bacterium]
MSDRRNEILDVAKQIFAEMGVKATTVREIGAQAGILSGSLYHHFGSKLDMVDAILSDFCREILEHYEAIVDSGDDAATRIRALARYAFSLIVEDRAALVMFFNEGRYLAAEPRFAYIGEFDRRIEAYWVDVLKAGVAEGQIRPDVDTRLIFRVVRDTIGGAVHWYEPTKGRSIEAIADEFMDMFLRGILVRDD